MAAHVTIPDIDLSSPRTDDPRLAWVPFPVILTSACPPDKIFLIDSITNEVFTLTVSAGSTDAG